MDNITIAPRRLFVRLIQTYPHMIHHEKLYIQCYNCNNLFMHKGQVQVNIVKVYLYVTSVLLEIFQLLVISSTLKCHLIPR